MEYVKIGDICTKVCSGGTPSSGNPSYYEGGSIPWLNTNEVNFCRIYSTEKKITQLGYENSAAKYIDENSVIVAMYGVTAGKSAIAKIRLTTNQACCNLSIDGKKADYEYVYYYLKLQSETLNKLANGGAQQNLNSKIIKDFKIPLPPLAIQHRIASILSAYDSQIENNQRRIKLLEQMVENLYKEWFVRFRFPGYENAEFEGGVPKGWVSLVGDNKKPKGWTYGELNQLGTFIRGKNITAAEMIEGQVPVISAGLEPAGYHNQANVCGPCLTISSSGANAGYLKYNLTDIWAADCSYYNNPDNIWFVYSSLKYLQPVISNLQCGAAQPHVYPKDVNRLCVILPPKSLITEYNRQSSLIFKSIHNLKNQIFLLTTQRDLLLPRLMSGKLSI